MINIIDLVRMVITISGKNLYIKNIDGPRGVLRRNSDNELIKRQLGWTPSQPLYDGIKLVCPCISGQVNVRE